MGEQAILTALKVDLQISSSAMDTYLGQLVTAAGPISPKRVSRLLRASMTGCWWRCMRRISIAGRREENVQMPRMLRWALNNRLFSQKARGT